MTDNEQTALNPTRSPSAHLFGHQKVADSACQRIRAHIDQTLPISAIDPGLTIGVMGAWGSGKSQMLKSIQTHFDATNSPPDNAVSDSADQATNKTTNTAANTAANTVQTQVVTVWFNAWRYERSPNLIVPLLETLNSCLQARTATIVDRTSNVGLTPASPLNPTEPSILKKAIVFVGRAIKAFSALGSAELSVKLQADALATIMGGLPAGLGKLLPQSGVEGELKLTLSPKNMVAAFQSSSAAPPATANASDDQATANEAQGDIYYDFEQQLKAITEGSQDGDQKERLYLLFLIDDLDRCLPERALETLETIKLFFNVPACGFVIALDDDVIERGVMHRYRDYLFNGRSQKKRDDAPTDASATALPITGAEYLEKIIQIPLRLSLPTEPSIEQFLSQSFPDLFDFRATERKYKELTASAKQDSQLAKEGSELATDELEKSSAKTVRETKDDPDSRDSRQREEDWLSQQAQLQYDRCTLFRLCIPPQPRKLLRAAETLRLARDACPPTNPAQELMLARLVIWQLFAPELYRLCHRQPLRFQDIANWYHMASQNSADFDWLNGKGALEDSDLIQYSLATVKGHDRQRQIRLRDAILASLHQRNEFDIGRLFDSSRPLADEQKKAVDALANAPDNSASTAVAALDPTHFNHPDWRELDNWRRFIWLDQKTELDIFQLKDVNSSGGTYGVVSDEAQFMARLMEPTGTQWYSALQEILQGGAIPPRLLTKIQAHKDFESRRQQDAWLQAVLPAIDRTQWQNAVSTEQQFYCALGLSPQLHWVKPMAIYACALFADDQRLVVAQVDGSLTLWDVAIGATLRGFIGHTDEVSSVAVTDDGQYIVSGSYDKTVKLWDVVTGACLKTFEGHTREVRSVGVTRDRQRIVSGSEDNTVKLWNVQSGECLRTFAGHKGRVLGVAITADGQRIVSGSEDKTVKLWDVASGERLHTFDGHTNWVNSVAVTADGGRIVSGSADKTVKLWDVDRGVCLRSFKGHTNEVDSVTVTRDGQCIVSGSRDNTVKLWDVDSGVCLHNFAGHRDWVRTVVLTADDQHIVSGSDDQTVKLWGVDSGKCLRTFGGLARCLNSIVVTDDGQRIVSGSADNTVKLWDVQSGECRRNFSGHTNWVISVVVTADGGRIVSGSADKTVKLWDVATGECLQTFEGHTNWVNSVALTDDEQRIVSGSWDNTVKLWDVHSGECLRSFKGHTNGVISVAVTGDGQRIVSGSVDNTVKLWDVNSGVCLRAFEGHTKFVSSVAVTRNGQRIVSGSDDNTVKLWDVASGACLRNFEGHTNGVNSVALTVDAKHIVSGSFDNTVKLWDVDSGQCLRTFEGHTRVVSSVAIAGNRIISGSDDGSIRYWDIATGQCIAIDLGLNRADVQASDVQTSDVQTNTPPMSLRWQPANASNNQKPLLTLHPAPDTPAKVAGWPLTVWVQDRQVSPLQPTRVWSWAQALDEFGDPSIQAALAQRPT